MSFTFHFHDFLILRFSILVIHVGIPIQYTYSLSYIIDKPRSKQTKGSELLAVYYPPIRNRVFNDELIQQSYDVPGLLQLCCTQDQNISSFLILLLSK